MFIPDNTTKIKTNFRINEKLSIAGRKIGATTSEINNIGTVEVQEVYITDEGRAFYKTKDGLIDGGNAIKIIDGSIQYISDLGPDKTKIALANGGIITREPLLSKNFALAKYGAIGSSQYVGCALNDGNALFVRDSNDFGYGSIVGSPAEFFISLPNQTLINLIRINLLKEWSKTPFSYQYQLFISQDGVKWDIVVDKSKGTQYYTSWQNDTFEPRLVQFIKVVGLRNSIPGNGQFAITEIEAYKTLEYKPLEGTIIETDYSGLKIETPQPGSIENLANKIDEALEPEIGILLPTPPPLPPVVSVAQPLIEQPTVIPEAIPPKDNMVLYMGIGIAGFLALLLMMRRKS